MAAAAATVGGFDEGVDKGDFVRAASWALVGRRRLGRMVGGGDTS